MRPTFWESVLLGAIHGLAAIFPVSQAGHLALAEMLFDLSSRELAQNWLLHLGTLSATIFMLWPRVKAALLAGSSAALKPALLTTTPGAQDALVVLLASLPSLLLSFGLRHIAERWSNSPLAIGLGFLVTAAVLVASRWAKPGRDEQPGVVGALLMGACQGLSVLPGLSSSAAGISVALLCGVRRERAFELALLASLPGACVALGLALFAARHSAEAWGSAGAAAVAGVAACLAAAAALWILRRSVAAGRLWWFAAWLFPVALATLALAKAWPHR